MPGSGSGWVSGASIEERFVDAPLHVGDLERQLVFLRDPLQPALPCKHAAPDEPVEVAWVLDDEGRVLRLELRVPGRALTLDPHGPPIADADRRVVLRPAARVPAHLDAFVRRRRARAR